MSRAVLLTAAILCVLGLIPLVAKIAVYDMPIAPTDTRGLWQVELRISVGGNGRRGRVTAQLPASDVGQVIFDERSSSDRLVFAIRADEKERLGVWSGWLEGNHEIVYEFRVQAFGFEAPLPPGPLSSPPDSVREAFGEAQGGEHSTGATDQTAPPLKPRH